MLVPVTWAALEDEIRKIVENMSLKTIIVVMVIDLYIETNTTYRLSYVCTSWLSRLSWVHRFLSPRIRAHCVFLGKETLPLLTWDRMHTGSPGRCTILRPKIEKFKIGK